MSSAENEIPGSMTKVVWGGGAGDRVGGQARVNGCGLHTHATSLIRLSAQDSGPPPAGPIFIVALGRISPYGNGANCAIDLRPRPLGGGNLVH
jgi:hypothetical protein